LNGEYLKNRSRANGINPNITAISNNSAIKQVKEILDLLKADTYSMVKSNSNFIKSLSFDIETMLLSCYYNGEECTFHDFHYWFSFQVRIILLFGS
jgi:hypothetical protein